MTHYSQPSPHRGDVENGQGSVFITSDYDISETLQTITSPGTLPEVDWMWTHVRYGGINGTGGTGPGFRFNGDSGSTNYGWRLRTYGGGIVDTDPDNSYTEIIRDSTSCFVMCSGLKDHPKLLWTLGVRPGETPNITPVRACGSWNNTTSKITSIEYGDIVGDYELRDNKDAGGMTWFGSKINGMGSGGSSMFEKVGDVKLTSSSATITVSEPLGFSGPLNKGQFMWLVVYLIPSTSMSPDMSWGDRNGNEDYDMVTHTNSDTASVAKTRNTIELPTIASPTFWSGPIRLVPWSTTGQSDNTWIALGVRQGTTAATTTPDSLIFASQEDQFSHPTTGYEFDEIKITADTGTFSAGSFMKVYQIKNRNEFPYDSTTGFRF